MTTNGYATLLQSFLRRQGHRVTTASSVAEARGKRSGLEFDLIVLDLMMPGESGLDFALQIREDSETPILMLTARSEAADRVRGLEAGVDDYLTKPFEPRELALRIASILRRTRSTDDPSRRPKSCDLARSSSIVIGRNSFAGDERIRLTEREREILSSLVAAAGQPVARETLAGGVDSGLDRSVDVLINRLRRKIEDDPANPRHLQTARGAGYRLVLDG